MPLETVGIHSEILRWDEWFGIVGLTKEWEVVKGQFPGDIPRQVRWAQIMELNRISQETDKNKKGKNMTKKKSTPESKINRMVKTGLVTVEDAVKPLRFYINKERHAESATCSDPEKCVIALALSEAVPDLQAVEVSSGITKVVTSSKCIRYRTPPRLRKALKHFDLTGMWGLPDGVYSIELPRGKQQLVKNMSEKDKKRIKTQAAKYKDRKKRGEKLKEYSDNGVFKCRPLPTRRISVTKGEGAFPINEDK